jgi:hypothetical protein
MKTVKILIPFGFALILLCSCQQKTSNDKASNNSDSISGKANTEFAAMYVNTTLKKIKIYYGNNKTEDYPCAVDDKNGLDMFYGLNNMVDALSYMDKKGWKITMNFNYGDQYGSQAIIFKK